MFVGMMTGERRAKVRNNNVYAENCVIGRGCLWARLIGDARVGGELG